MQHPFKGPTLDDLELVCHRVLGHKTFVLYVYGTPAAGDERLQGGLNNKVNP